MSTFSNSTLRTVQSIPENAELLDIIKLDEPSSHLRFPRRSRKKQRDFFTRSVAPVIRIMQIFGFFPSPLVHTLAKDSCGEHGWKQWGLMLVCFLLLCLNAFYAGQQFDRLLTKINQLGILHHIVAAEIVARLKPLLNMVNLVIFWWKVRQHRRLMRYLNVVDNVISEFSDKQPPLRRYMAVFISGLLFTAVATLGLIIAQWQSRPANMDELEHVDAWMTFHYYASYIFVPLLSVWNVLPLLYYDFLNKIMVFWLVQLQNYLQSDTGAPKSMRYFYFQFLRMVKLQSSMGKCFGIMILCSLLVSMASLCFAFSWTTSANFDLIQKSIDPHTHRIVYGSIIFNVMWTIAQAVMSIAYVMVLCMRGSKTNEETRKILKPILRKVVAQLDTEEERFFVECLKDQFDNHNSWGMSMNGLFFLRRNTLFQLTGLMSTYAFLMIELRGTDFDCDGLRQILNHTSSK